MHFHFTRSFHVRRTVCVSPMRWFCHNAWRYVNVSRPPSWSFSSAHITRSQLVRRNQQAHCTHPAPHPLRHVAQPAFFQCPFCAFSTAIRCLTRTRSQLKIQEPRTMDTTRWFASSVTSSRSCHVANISPLQLKAGLSLHCVTNRGLPFLFETVATKTAQHKGRWMINHFVKR